MWFNKSDTFANDWLLDKAVRHPTEIHSRCASWIWKQNRTIFAVADDAFDKTKLSACLSSLRAIDLSIFCLSVQSSSILFHRHWNIVRMCKQAEYVRRYAGYWIYSYTLPQFKLPALRHKNSIAQFRALAAIIWDCWNCRAEKPAVSIRDHRIKTFQNPSNLAPNHWTSPGTSPLKCVYSDRKVCSSKMFQAAIPYVKRLREIIVQPMAGDQ